MGDENFLSGIHNEDSQKQTEQSSPIVGFLIHEIEDGEAEELLLSQPAGTFIIRRNKNAQDVLIDFVGSSGVIIHVNVKDEDLKKEPHAIEKTIFDLPLTKSILRLWPYDHTTDIKVARGIYKLIHPEWWVMPEILAFKFKINHVANANVKKVKELFSNESPGAFLLRESVSIPGAVVISVFRGKDEIKEYVFTPQQLATDPLLVEKAILQHFEVTRSIEPLLDGTNLYTGADYLTYIPEELRKILSNQEQVSEEGGKASTSATKNSATDPDLKRKPEPAIGFFPPPKKQKESPDNTVPEILAFKFKINNVAKDSIEGLFSNKSPGAFLIRSSTSTPGDVHIFRLESSQNLKMYVVTAEQLKTNPMQVEESVLSQPSFQKSIMPLLDGGEEVFSVDELAQISEDYKKAVLIKCLHLFFNIPVESGLSSLGIYSAYRNKIRSGPTGWGADEETFRQKLPKTLEQLEKEYLEQQKQEKGQDEQSNLGMRV